MTITANWSYPTAIKFGASRIKELADHCKAVGMKKPLLVTDRGLSTMAITQNALDILEAAGLGRAMFAEVDPNPTDRNLEAGVKAFKAGGHDGVVAFGGGSGLDLGKAVAFMAGQTRPVWDFEDVGDWWTRANSDGIAPIVAVPTTAGTGMDAFAHCLEAYSSPFYHPMSQGIALEGMRLVKEYLPRAYRDGTDIEARANMMSAAAMGAVAFQKGLGAIHSLSHPVGAIYNTHHGMTNAVVMPPVLTFNRPAIEARIASAAAYLGIAGGFDGFFDYVLRLREELGVPDKLAALGVGTDRIDEMAAMAIVDPTAGGNPVELTLDAAKRLFVECI